MAKYIISIIVLIAFSAIFSATETAFTSLNTAKIKKQANEDVKNAELVLLLVSKYDKLLSTILIGNNIANIACTAIATIMFIELLGPIGGTVATVVITLLVLIFGEITPKNFAKEKDEEFSLFIAPFINFLMYLFAPLNLLFSSWKRLISGISNASEEPEYTEDELKNIVDEAMTGGGINEDQSRLIKNSIEFAELEAIDIVTPRTDIIAIEIETTNAEIGKEFKESGLSRLPVYEDDLDDIIGVLNQKDFHNYVIAEKKSVKDYIKPVAYVAETMKASLLLRRMQEKKTHIAIVVDEYGGTTGIVTMEDIIEELVGKIYDEHDSIEYREVTLQRDGSYKVAGGTNVEKFFEMTGEDIEFEDATTVNGWVMIELDRLPRVGDSFDFETRHKIYHVGVTKADGRRALMTRIYIEDKPEEEE